MKTHASLIALMATLLPTPAGASAVPHERKFCANVSVRAGTRLSGRRICLTQTQWRTALGPDWRQHLNGNRGLEDDYDSMMARVSPDNGVHGQQPRAGGLGAGRGGH